MKHLILMFVFALAAHAQIRQPAQNIRFGSALPSTCTANIGQVFFLTSASAGANVYGCTATNTWTVQGGGSATIGGTIATGQICYASASNTCAGSNNLFWDGNRLGIGTNAPSVALHVIGTATISAQLNTSTASANYLVDPGSSRPYFDLTGTARVSIVERTTSAAVLTVLNTGQGGIGKGNISPTGTLSILDRTAGSGATSLLVGSDGTNTSATTTQVVVKAGSAQSSTNLQEWQNNSGTALLAIRTSNLGGFAFLAPGDNIIDFQTGGAVVHKQRDAGGTTEYFHSSTTNFVLPSGHAFGFASTATAGGTLDTSLSRIAPGIVGVGTGAAGSVAGALRAAGYMAGGGTKFTASGCSNSATVGGATAGTYTSGTTGACTVTITMNGATGLTATNGWACSASDLTTPANLISQSASSATTATLTGTTVSGDVISFHCIGY